ncbi:tRNA(adenine34) deaminase [Sphingomonas sp. SORGH_AS 950]|uniref:nucleoside deaminase n=1 Tax=Sphingomonas sp. SORGH_AS_0950 TaxID=3041792 RepID=UPI0027897C34|nr:nucleoside deaminase [Sphingomonas sp. SORGH_AS_0950]MDQ1159010.1 tRNA(adenine34) deaminase [Sphingomonas sp. SORGH_AS_0950]
MDQDETMMGMALDEARSALAEGYLPVGAVLASDGTLLGRGRKGMESNHLDHAEMVVFRQVFSGDYRYTRADPISLYTTLEPCIMCWGTLRHLPIRRLVYAMSDPYGGCAAAEVTPTPPRHLSRPLEVIAGVRQREARELFRRFLDTTTESFWINGGASEFVAQVRCD